MAIVFLVCLFVSAVGMALLVFSLIERRRRRAQHDFIGPIGGGAVLLGLVLTVAGGGGDYAVYRFGKGIPALPSFTGATNMTLTGTIELTRNWALLDLDPGQKLNGQPIQGPVILMMQAGGQNPGDLADINTAFQYFGQHAGAHYTLIGTWQPTAARQFFFVQQVNKN